jgi:integrase
LYPAFVSLSISIVQTKKPTDKRRDETIPKTNDHLSKNGKWRSFPRVPNLLQYVGTGQYFARVKVKGKLIRRKLDTDVFTTAKEKLRDFISDERESATAEQYTFKECRLRYEAQIDTDPTLKPVSKRYRKFCAAALLKSWPKIDDERADKITEDDCLGWAARFVAGQWRDNGKPVDEQFFNNTLGTLRAILELAKLKRNPARAVKRLGVQSKELKLPEASRFAELVTAIEIAGGGQSKHCADLVRFLAFSGCRVSEARQVTWQDCDFERSQIRVTNAKRRLSKNHAPFRFVPMIADMRPLLERLRESNPKPADAVCVVGECEKSLTRACRQLGIPRITHHDLRHLFATRCIESGVDIPTVAKWLGHKDGGALAMKVYGHLRDEHSVAMAQKVSFSATSSDV